MVFQLPYNTPNEIIKNMIGKFNAEDMMWKNYIKNAVKWKEEMENDGDADTEKEELRERINRKIEQIKGRYNMKEYHEVQSYVMNESI